MAINLECCPHCGCVTGLYVEHHRIQRCYICGYWNDPRYPLRHPTHMDRYGVNDLTELKERAKEIPIPPGCKGGRPKVSAEEKKLHKKLYNQQYQKKYRQENRERLNAEKREKYAANHNGEHYGLGPKAIHG